MKTPVLPISIIIFSIIGLILFSSSIVSKNPYGSNSSRDSGFILLGQKEGTTENLSYFERKETEIEYKLTYGWKDYSSIEHTITFTISKKELREADDEFGYYPEELKKYLERQLKGMREEMILSLKRFISQLIANSKYPQYILIEEIDALNFKLKISVPPPHYKEVKAEFDRIKGQLTKEQNRYFKKIEEKQERLRRDYYKKRGFRTVGDGIGVNYSLCVQNNRNRVKQVMAVMKKKNKRLSLSQFLSLMLAFIQEIRFGIPPLKENEKFILEFWVPPKVLVYNLGDCDSKGVTFASLWTSFKRYPAILIRIPRHMFVGLAIPSIREEGIMINGLKYTLCEVTGPDKMPPGLISPYSQFYLEGGQFRYELIR